MMTDDADREQVLRDKAVRQLKKQRDFRRHLLVYILVNTFLVVIWLLTDPHGFWWRRGRQRGAGTPRSTFRFQRRPGWWRSRQVKMIWPPAAMA